MMNAERSEASLLIEPDNDFSWNSIRIILDVFQNIHLAEIFIVMRFFASAGSRHVAQNYEF